MLALLSVAILSKCHSSVKQQEKGLAYVRKVTKGTGQCYCGNFQVTVTRPSAVCGYCHCLECRKWHGAPTNAFSVWPSTSVIIEGETLMSEQNRCQWKISLSPLQRLFSESEARSRDECLPNDFGYRRGFLILRAEHPYLLR